MLPSVAVLGLFQAEAEPPDADKLLLTELLVYALFACAFLVTLYLLAWMLMWMIHGSPPSFTDVLVNILPSHYMRRRIIEGRIPVMFHAHLPDVKRRPIYPRSEESGSSVKEVSLPHRVTRLFMLYPGWWCIAGGWALDLYVGRRTREHGDVEVAALRREQQLLAGHLPGWQPRYVDSTDGHTLKPWAGTVVLDPPIHQIRTTPIVEDITELDILLNESDGPDWAYRRDGRIRLPLSQAIIKSASGIPVLAPEIVLLYKSKDTRDKDRADFDAVIGTLSAGQRRWLHEALLACAPGHPWIERTGGR